MEYVLILRLAADIWVYSYSDFQECRFAAAVAAKNYDQAVCSDVDLNLFSPEEILRSKPHPPEKSLSPKELDRLHWRPAGGSPSAIRHLHADGLACF
jgi:hypothetical protein